eukprot:1195898-Prorocentrum_minimum.AAC.10
MVSLNIHMVALNIRTLALNVHMIALNRVSGGEWPPEPLVRAYYYGQARPRRRQKHRRQVARTHQATLPRCSLGKRSLAPRVPFHTEETDTEGGTNRLRGRSLYLEGGPID